MLNLIDAPAEALFARPLIGNGADGPAGTERNGGPGGFLYGNGGNGGASGDVGGRGGLLFGQGGASGPS